MEKNKVMKIALKITESVLEVLKEELTDDTDKKKEIKVDKNEQRDNEKDPDNCS